MKLRHFLFVCLLVAVFSVQTAFTYKYYDQIDNECLKQEASIGFPLSWCNNTQNFTNCHGGQFVGNSTTNWCNCPAGWGGMDCSVCLADSSCSDGYVCDKTPSISTYKAFNCVSPPPGVGGLGAITAQFIFNQTNGTMGSGIISAYDSLIGPPFLFNCTFVNCTKAVTYSDQTDTYQETVSCENVTDCIASWEGCSQFLLAMLPRVGGPSSFECSISPGSQTNNCTAFLGLMKTNNSLPFPLVCQAGGCQAHFYTPPPPLLTTTQIVFICIGGFLAVAAFIGLIAAACIIVRRRKTAYYLRTRNMDEYSITLAFEDIYCTIGKGNKKKTIVNGANGVCLPGELTAIIGPSGAGKTSFLDILAGRKNVGQLSGHVLVNGAPRRSNFQRISGYVLQDEKLIGTLTVQEHLMFVAQLRLPSAMPYDEKVRKVIAPLQRTQTCLK